MAVRPLDCLDFPSHGRTGRKHDFFCHSQFARWCRIGPALQGHDPATRNRDGAHVRDRRGVDTILPCWVHHIDSRRRQREHACRLYVGPWPSLPAGDAISREPAASSG
jgi:hypothetical protein